MPPARCFTLPSPQPAGQAGRVTFYRRGSQSLKGRMKDDTFIEAVKTRIQIQICFPVKPVFLLSRCVVCLQERLNYKELLQHETSKAQSLVCCFGYQFLGLVLNMVSMSHACCVTFLPNKDVSSSSLLAYVTRTGVTHPLYVFLLNITFPVHSSSSHYPTPSFFYLNSVLTILYLVIGDHFLKILFIFYIRVLCMYT